MTQDLSAVPWPVRTDRLLIRPATPEDTEATWRIRSIPEVHEWLGRSFTDRAAYDERMADPAWQSRTLVIELDGEVVGDLYLELGDAWAQVEVADRAKGTQAEIGWVLSPAHAGHGYATEAAEALLLICFEHLGLRRVQALCFADNVPSWRLMERIGMRREEHNIADSLHRTRGWLDGFGYSLLADEWRAARGR